MHIKVLSSNEVLSSDEAESEEEKNEEGLDKMGKRIESNLLNNKSSNEKLKMVQTLKNLRDQKLIH